MPAETNSTRITNATALSLDLVNKFNNRMKSLYELLGINRVLKVQNGSSITVYKAATVTLDNTEVAPGDIIPLSKVELQAAEVIPMVWDKKRKAVPAEDIQKYGFNTAIEMTDDALIRELQKKIRTDLIANLATGTGTATGANLQEVFAQNWGKVTSTFSEDDVQVISFINNMDAADYLGSAEITTQTLFGMQYLEGFMNNKLVFMHPSIPEGTVYSTADQNLIAAFVDMTNANLDEFDFVNDSTGAIGVTHDINKQRLTAETITASAVKLYAEVLDGVVVGTITPEVAGA